MKAANPSHAEALVLVDEMVRSGIRHACLSPGSRSAALALALADEERIRLHVSIDERSASFFALGIAKATRRAVPVITTSGTAAANLYPAVVEAHHSRTPLLVLTADRPPELRHTGASQTIDQIKMFGDSVRWFCDLGVPEDAPHSNALWRSTMARAVAAAEGSPAGPVHLNLAFREPLVPSGSSFANDLSGRENGAPWMSIAAPGPGRLSPDDTERLVRRFSGRRGLIVAGAGHHGSGIHSLAEELAWPLLAEASSGLRYGPRSITTYDSCLKVEAWAERHQPEMVVRLGSVTLSKPLARTLRRAEQILVDPDGWWLDPDRDVQHLIRASAADFAASLRGKLSPAPEGWAESWAAADEEARGVIDKLLDENGISEPRVARDVVREAPSGSNIVVAASMPLRDVESFAPRRDDVRFISNRGANGIDGFVSTALGVAEGTGTTTFALCGDLSFLHDQNGLMALKGAGAAVKFVVINNDGGGIFSFLPQAEFPARFEEVFGTPHGLDLARLAAVYEQEHVLVKEPDDLGVALGGDATVIEVRTDRRENVRMHKALQKAVGEVLN